jgi:hypothetical protein
MSGIMIWIWAIPSVLLIWSLTVYIKESPEPVPWSALILASTISLLPLINIIVLVMGLIQYSKGNV